MLQQILNNTKAMIVSAFTTPWGFAGFVLVLLPTVDFILMGKIGYLNKMLQILSKGGVELVIALIALAILARK